MHFQKNKKRKKLYHNSGFAIPQILIIGIGIAVGVSSLMAASILSLTGSKINRQELLAKASSYSGITKIKSLFNDNTKGRLFNYFWLVNNCSEKAYECNTTKVESPKDQYWADSEWCNGEENCSGRQKAPFCPPSQISASWSEENEMVRNLLINSNLIQNSSNDASKDFEQSFNIISTKYIGTEEYGINSILIEGLAIPKNSTRQSASNKLRVNIQVNSKTTKSGFGFISAGENNSDKFDSLYLGNLNITPSQAKGSIIWRMNLTDGDCKNFKDLANGEDSNIPDNENGGIWVQPLGLPKQPRLKNVVDLGTLICSRELSEQNSSNCKLDAGNKTEKTFRINSLFVTGDGSKFEVSTSDTSKIILEIMGDIDISNGGEICHKNNSESCGSGKPENLTILFKQKNIPKENKLVCNRIDKTGGVRFKDISYLSNYEFPIDNDRLPGSSFLIDNTENNFSNKFGAFIYGPKTTFISITPKSKWIQTKNEESFNNNGLIVASRGSYGYIKNILGTSVEDKITNLILTPDFELIPYSGYTKGIKEDIEVIGIGTKINQLPGNSQFNDNAKNVFLIFDKSNANYHLRTFTSKKINRFTESNLQYSLPGSFAVLDIKNPQNFYDLGKNLKNNIAKEWLDAFGIDIKEVKNNPIRNFSGAVWVKNFCLDETGIKNWEFSEGFIKNLIKWHGKSYNWGIKYYRGQSTILWDTLRDFKPG